MRQLVASRAKNLCEYCLIAEADTFLGCHIDHIISLKHGGETVFDNLAYACVVCNSQKGSDLGSISQKTGELVRFFNPRIDLWPEHFRLRGAIFQGLTEIGRVTIRILGFNSEEQVIERQTLIANRQYPSAVALQVMQPSGS